MLSKILTVAVLSAVSVAYAQTAPSPLSFRTVRLEAKSCHGKDQEHKPICHESAVAYPVTGNRHLDNWVRKQFHGTLPTQRSVQAKLNRNEIVRYTNQENPQDMRKGEPPCRLQFADEWSLGGYTPNYAVFRHDTWEFACGPRGLGNGELFVLKRGAAHPQPVKLDNILLPNQKARLANLLKAAYVKYLAERGRDSDEQEVSEQETLETLEYVNGRFGNGFQITNDWRFDKNGLTFEYDIGELGTYVEGGPELTIPVKDLQGIIKPEILREIQHYRAKPER